MDRLCREKLSSFSSDTPPLGLFADLDETLVYAVLPHQCFVGAALGHPAVGDHQDLIGVPDGGQAVGNGDNGLAPGQLRQGVLDQMLVLGIDAGGGLVQDDDGASFKIAWAMEMRCFSPPEKLPPPSPTTVSYPLGRAMTKS